MDVEVTIKVGWQATGLVGQNVRPVPSIDVKLSNAADDDAGQQITEILLEAAQGVTEAIIDATKPRPSFPVGVALSDAHEGDQVPIALGAISSFARTIGEPLDLGDERDRGVEVSGWLIIDDYPVQVAAVHTSTPHFMAVADAIEEVSRAFRAGDEDADGYDPQWPTSMMSRAMNGSQRCEFVSHERVLEYEREHEIVDDAKEIVHVGRAIADCEPAMRVLDTAYAADGRGGPLGARLREVVGSGLPHFPRSMRTHPEEYPLSDRDRERGES